MQDLVDGIITRGRKLLGVIAGSSSVQEAIKKLTSSGEYQAVGDDKIQGKGKDDTWQIISKIEPVLGGKPRVWFNVAAC